MFNWLFAYLLKVHDVFYVFPDETPRYNRLCSWLLNTFFMRRKLEYCELIGLRQKVKWLLDENKRYEKKLDKALRMYAAHAGVPEESWVYEQSPPKAAPEEVPNFFADFDDSCFKTKE